MMLTTLQHHDEGGVNMSPPVTYSVLDAVVYRENPLRYRLGLPGSATPSNVLPANS